MLEAAIGVIDDCDHASITIRADGRYLTVAASNAHAELAGLLEGRLRDGPGIAAIEEEATQVDADIAAGCQWPELAEQLLAQTAIRRTMCFRLLIDDCTAGSLNLFTDTPGIIMPDAVDRGAVLASFASVALMTLSERNRIETLTRVLTFNRDIGKAIGLLMAEYQIGEAQAFEILRTTCQDMKMTIAQAARKVIDCQQVSVRRDPGEPV